MLPEFQLSVDLYTTCISFLYFFTVWNTSVWLWWNEYAAYHWRSSSLVLSPAWAQAVAALMIIGLIILIIAFIISFVALCCNPQHASAALYRRTPYFLLVRHSLNLSVCWISGNQGCCAKTPKYESSPCGLWIKPLPEEVPQQEHFLHFVYWMLSK